MAALSCSLLAILVVAVVTVGAATGNGAAGPRVLVVPATQQGKAALAQSSARLIADYGSFSLVEATGADIARLARAGAAARDGTRYIELNGRTLDPRTERAPLGHKRSRPRGPGLAVVQFVGPVKDAWLARLRATGMRVITYMAQDAYLVYGSGPQLRAVAGLPGSDPAVRAAVPYRASDKLLSGTGNAGRVRVTIQTVSGSDGAAARRSIERAARELRQESTLGSTTTQFVALDGRALTVLAGDPSVVSIGPYVAPHLRDERAAQIVAGNLTANVPSGTGYLSWLTGQGFDGSQLPFAIDVTDEGLDTGSTTPAHPDFFFNGSTSNADRVVYINNTTNDSNGRDCGGHGTNVASIAAGFNNGTTSSVEDAQGYNYGLGIAPAAQIGASKIFRCTNGMFQNSGGLAALASKAYENGARLSSNSWGADTAGGYNADSQTYDAIVRDARSTQSGNQQMVEIFAAGNAGPGTKTVGSPGTAKNVIAVGASENVRGGGTDGCGVTDADANDAHDVVDFSSRGPTADGRMKPDLVAPGTHVTGASPQHAGYTGSGTCDPQFPAGNTLYSRVSGTSQATPEVSGAAAMVMDWFRRTQGGGSTLPSPAMVKAILVNAASDMTGGSMGDGALGTLGNAPDDNQGWGRVNLGNVLDGTTRDYRDQADLLSTTGQSLVRAYDVADTGKPVKVTLAWTDPPGPTSGNAFVNDLDLVVDAGGRIYRGNQLFNGSSVAGGSSDTRNNLENVFLPASTSGRISAQVLGTNVAGDGVPGNGDSTDQDFALVVSNGNQTTAPVLSHQSTSVGDVAGDNDGVVEPGEPFTVSETVRNSGNSSAMGVSGALSSSAPGLSITQANSPFPDIGTGASAANSTAFAASLASGAPCGTDLPMTLGLTTAQGVYQVPVSVPTGAVGSPVTRNSTDVPKAIPDGNTTGVTSDLVVSQSGIIKDVNVRVDQITHTWDGDLKIELIAPDSTTIQLVNRVGGVNNNGNNFTNTVFDDEAASGVTSGAVPYTGSFRPQGDQLSRLDGKQQQGTWKLRVTDLFPADSGTLGAWGSDISPALCNVAPPNQPPTASFTVSPPSPLTNQTTTF
ncbi:MAG: S8 family serine peptidase, partial [Solirubrobacterales bacterium]